MQAWPLAHGVAADAGFEPAARLADLFDAHQPQLYRLARRLTASRDDALDLVQEAFLRAARHLHRIPAGRTDEEAWLVRVLVNLQRDRWRRQKVRIRHAWTHAPAATGPAAPPSALTSAIVWQALANLGPRRRAIIVLHELEGRSAAEIGRLLGITGVTVRWHLSRGRTELAAALRADVSEARHTHTTGRMR